MATVKAAALGAAGEVIAKLDDLRQAMNMRHCNFDGELDGIQEQWEQLGSINGQRDDHAAHLMARLRFHLHDMAQFCAVVEQQIDGLVANPFGRNDK